MPVSGDPQPQCKSLKPSKMAKKEKISRKPFELRVVTAKPP